MIAVIWGVFIWREFASAPAGTNKLLLTMFISYIVGIVLIIAFISTLVLSLLLPWLFESKVVAMTVLGLAMACWIAVLAIAEAALRIS
ncbi:hypothetical protein, partial [Pseudomonas aeruginosa]|uniref:hypothetical protein n=1 Tax=Pseudomonas aeruginosa TaxID=287 RepID=UPI0031B687AF